MNKNDYQRRGLDPLPSYIVLVCLISGALLGVALIGGVRVLLRQVDPQQRALYLEEQAALLPGAIVRGVVVQVMQLAGLVAFAAGLIRLGLLWLRYLEMQSSLIYPRDGIFPLVRLPNGGFYDANRDNLGVHPHVTMAALDVQRAAAFGAAGSKLSIKVDRALTEGTTAAAIPTPEIHALPDMVALQQVVKSPSLDSLVIGVSESGPVRMSIHELMHVLLVGVTGFGKSAFFRMLIYQLALCREPVDVVAIDANGSEFNALRSWERLLYPVARDTEATIRTLGAVTAEIARRKTLYERYPAAYNLISYNQASPDSLPPLVVLFDEGTNQLNRRGVGAPLRDVVQTARQYGVYLLLAGQSANHKVISTQVRDNFPTRVCLYTSPASRRTVLDETVKASTKKGRAWVRVPGQPLFKMQIPFITREEFVRALSPRAGSLALVGDTKSDTSGDTADTTGDTSIAQRIRALSAQGASLRAIQENVYGYQGGAAYAAVCAVLSDTTER